MKTTRRALWRRLALAFLILATGSALIFSSLRSSPGILGRQDQLIPPASTCSLRVHFFHLSISSEAGPLNLLQLTLLIIFLLSITRALQIAVNT